MRGRNLKKMLDAINLLAQPCGTTVSELGRRLAVDKRQVYRTIETLQDDFKFAVTKDKSVLGGEVRYYLDKDQFKRLSDMKVADLNLSMGEIISLYFLKGHAMLYHGTDIADEIDRAFAKLDAFVPDGLSDRLEKIKTLFIPSAKFAKDYSGKEEIFETLTDAILQQKTCLVKYHSFHDDQVKSYKIDPLRFFERNAGVYLFTRTTTFGDIRVLAVERIIELTMTDDTFEAPMDFDPQALLDSAFDIVLEDPLEVKIWVSADQARYVKERTWAREQRIGEKSDGSIILEMTTSGWWHVKKWVLSFGAEAKILKPGKLRDEVVQELKAALESYQKTPKSRLPSSRSKSAD